MTILESIAGTRDFYPNDMQFRNWLVNIWKQIATSYTFVEYDAPIVERAELYTTNMDEIVGQMFRVNDKLVLRPEMTKSLARMMTYFIGDQSLPIRWFNVGQCWRDEDIKRGRKKEFYQFNVDIFGANNNKYIIELLLICIDFFEKIGLTSADIQLHISHRQIIYDLLKQYGLADDQIMECCRILDRIDKDELDITIFKLNNIGLVKDNVFNILDFMKCTDVADISKYIESDKISELIEIFSIVELKDWLKLDMKIIRGLSYYTGIVFEGFSTNPNIKRAIVGGGRYDNILANFGYHRDTKTIGFGMGDVVIKELLIELDRLPKFEQQIKILIVPFKTAYTESVKIAKLFRSKYNTTIYAESKHLKVVYKYADSNKFTHVVIIGPDEIKNNIINIKNMKTNTTKILNLTDNICL